MKHISIKSILVVSSLALVACAHQKKTPDVHQAAWRVEDKGAVTTGMPNYVLSPEVFEAASAQVANSRKPAKTDEALAHDIEAADKKPSLRRLYFRSLYQQFKDLKSVGQSKHQINSCPQFHHDKLVMDEENRSSVVSFGPSMAKPEMSHLAFYPEWMLPVGKGKTAKSIWSSKGSAQTLIKKAVGIQAGKVHRELKILCEEGASDSYFRLENMVTYFAGHPELKAKNGLRAFLKIPAFSNMLLLQSAQVGNAKGLTVHDHNLIEEVKGLQFERYIVELRKKRFSLATGSL